MKDQAIIDLYWARDPRAVTASEEAYGAYCRAVARGILWDERDGEECVSDTWHRAWLSMPPRRPAVLRAFFGKITRNLALHLYERQHAQKRGGGQVPLALEELEECIPSAHSVENALEGQALSALLDRFLRELPSRERVIFLRRYWYLCPVKDIARSMGLGESLVKMSLSRTRQRLRQMLEKEDICL